MTDTPDDPKKPEEKKPTEKKPAGEKKPTSEKKSAAEKKPATEKKTDAKAADPKSTEPVKSAEEKPVATEKPAAAEPTPEKPAAVEKPATETPAATTGDATKPAPTAATTGDAAKPAPSAAAAAAAAAKAAGAGAAKPAAAAAHGAAAPEPPKELPIGPFGQFLKDLGINSTRHPDHFGTFGMVECIEIDAKDLEQAMRHLRGSETKLNYLLMVSGVESPDTFDSVYHLWSYYDMTKELVVKVRIPKAGIAEGQLPAIPSITPFWPAANWHEREEYDLMGIKYFGHPYLRRLMNPWDWEGHPLRKDYKQPIDALNDKNPHSMR